MTTHLSVLIAAALIAALVVRAPIRRGRARRLRHRLPGRSPSWATTRSPSRLERGLAERLQAADVDWPSEGVGRAGAGAVAVVFVLGLAGGGPVLALVGTVVLAVGGVGGLLGAGGRREARIERELPALLEAVARALRSGAALPSALREAAGTGSLAAAALTEVLVEVDRGLSLGHALERWAERHPVPAVRLVVGALSVALASGGPPARAVDGVAATLRERAEVDREVRALATQARASAAVVTLAPLAFAVLGALGDQRTATFLLRTPAGLACLVTGLTLDGIGAAWMARIARGPV